MGSFQLPPARPRSKKRWVMEIMCNASRQSVDSTIAISKCRIRKLNGIVWQTKLEMILASRLLNSTWRGVISLSNLNVCLLSICLQVRAGGIDSKKHFSRVSETWCQYKAQEDWPRTGSKTWNFKMILVL